ncbi:MAG: hypothetical protein A2505_00130 [Deltaproteobacteria bacterium RIFOXYD12_FULL_55_16]|nr:MAG: hypothetical protein A2505_00130 [Deltaproteobacteria bacterium RIFOXYD12_FULL_55_16]
MGKSLVELAAELVQAQCITRAMNPEELAQALQSAFCVLQALQAGEAKLQAGISEENAAEGCSAPEINPAKSIQKNKIICLECGQEFRMLSSKHLRSHELTGREYRIKWGLSLRQPLCARSLTEKRSKAAKERGLPEELRKSIAGRKKNQGPKAASEK